MIRKTYLQIIAAILIITLLIAAVIFTSNFVAPMNGLDVTEECANHQVPGIGGTLIGPEDWLVPEKKPEPSGESPNPLPEESEPSESSEESGESSTSESSFAPESSASSPGSKAEPSQETSSVPSGESASESGIPSRQPESSASSANPSSEPSGPPPVSGSYETEESAGSSSKESESLPESSSSRPPVPPPESSSSREPEPPPESSSSRPPVPPPESSSSRPPVPPPESSDSREPEPPPESSSSGPPVPPPESSEPESGETLRVMMNGVSITGNAYDILCQVVEAEVSGKFHIEALKAQAVAAYTYIRYENQNGRTPYTVGRTPTQKTRDAVLSVLGEALYYGNQIAFTPYHASSTGYTSASSDVWGGAIPYLVSVVSKYDPAPYCSNQKKIYDAAVLKPKIENYMAITLPDDPAKWFGELVTSQGGYVLRMTVNDTAGNSHKLTGRQMRENILEYGIRCHAFTITVSGNQIIFTTNGYGHGVGMSQTGANAYAIHDGWTYDQILSHYYPGTTLS